MSLQKLNLNTMKVASPMSADALKLLSQIENKDIVYTRLNNDIDEQIEEDERDEIIDIEVTSEFKTIKEEDMATQLPTKEEIKELGYETALVYMCLKLDKNDSEIMDRLSITSNRLNKHYNKLSDLGYIKRSIVLLERESALNVPQNAPGEVILHSNQLAVTQVEEQTTEITEDEFQTVPSTITKSTDEILFDTYKDIHKSTFKRKFNKGDVFNLDSRDREYDFEKEITKNKNNYIQTL